MDLSALPEIVLEAPFAKQVGVAANGLLRMSDEGTLPKPFARRGTKPVWREDDITEFFGNLQPQQSAYAPVDKLGVSDLATTGTYICPASSSGHIGNRRPTYLALCVAGWLRDSTTRHLVEVYDVEWVQTQRGVAGEEVITPKGVDERSIVPLSWGSIGRETDYPLTLFKLDLASKRTLKGARGVQRGGTISTESLEKALSTPDKLVYFRDGLVHMRD